MCEPISIGLALAAATMAMGAVQSKMKNDAAKADYYSKVQNQLVTTQEARADREAGHQVLLRERAAAERKSIGNQMESTLKAEELRGVALAQGANGGVASGVFDQFERNTTLKEGEIETSNVFALGQNALALETKSKGEYRKQAARMWRNRAGSPPVNTFAIDMLATTVKAAGAGISAYGAASAAGIGSGGGGDIAGAVTS
jgi:hypothetical protein